MWYRLHFEGPSSLKKEGDRCRSSGMITTHTEAIGGSRGRCDSLLVTTRRGEQVALGNPADVCSFEHHLC